MRRQSNPRSGDGAATSSAAHGRGAPSTAGSTRSGSCLSICWVSPCVATPPQQVRYRWRPARARRSCCADAAIQGREGRHPGAERCIPRVGAPPPPTPACAHPITRCRAAAKSRQGWPDPCITPVRDTQSEDRSAVTRPTSSTFATREATQGVAALLPIGPEAKARIRVLVVDDEHTLRETCASVLQLEGYDVTACARGQEALDLLKRRPFDVALVDRYMSQVDGLELLRAALAANPQVLVVMMTGNPSVESSVEALREGAWDYLPKPFSATHLQILIGRAAHTLLVAQETEEQQVEGERPPAGGEGVVLLGEAPAFQRTMELARRVAATDASGFLTGESGSGKEVIAQFIHSHSRRSSRPFVAINCAALPEGLLESEMFGHRKGAFTGAVRDKPGLLEAAHGGTLFLDELTEMSKAIQAKLLRVIQDGVVRRVGSETNDAVVNVRFIAATNGDAEAAVKGGSLREDLYYRLRVVPIHVPPLRERPEDIPLLAEYFLSTYWIRHRHKGAPFPKLGDAAIRGLCGHNWRGNVRELQNAIEHVAGAPRRAAHPGRGGGEGGGAPH